MSQTLLLMVETSIDGANAMLFLQGAEGCEGSICSKGDRAAGTGVCGGVSGMLGAGGALVVGPDLGLLCSSNKATDRGHSSLDAGLLETC
jgi:hypothetical protein